MEKFTCNLTNNDFYLSSLEQSFFLNRNLELPNYSEIERFRTIFASIPLPDFNSLEIVHHSFPLLNSTSFEIKDQKPKIPPAGFLDDLFSIKEYYLNFILDFDFNKVINNGDPLLYGSYNMTNCFECNFCIDCIDCYDCISCYDSKDVYFSRLANSCRDCYFLDNCFYCQNCLFCSNLSNSKFHIFNKEVSEVEYFSTLNALNMNEDVRLYSEKERFQNFLKNQPFFQIYSDLGFSLGFPCEETEDKVNICCRDSENSSSLLIGSNVRECFGSGFLYGKISDCFSSGMIVGEGNNIRRSIDCYGNLKNIDLSISCSDSSDLFACVGLKDQSYNIFNFQFSRNEYLKIKKEIDEISFDEGISSYFLPSMAKIVPYNKSIASILFPLNKVQAEIMGYAWDLKEDTVNIPMDGSKLICEIMGTPFEIPERQHLFCKDKGIALPQRSPLQRFQERLRSIAPTNMRISTCQISGKLLKLWSNENREYISKDIKYLVP
jgi:hypothetical protein